MKSYFTIFIMIVAVSFKLLAINPNCSTSSLTSPIVLKPIEFNNFGSFDRSKMGITNFDLLNRHFIVIGQAQKYEPSSSQFEQRIPLEIKDGASWTLLDSLYLNSFLPAGANIGVRINIPKRRLDLITPYNLTNQARAAVQKAPRWIRPELENTLSQVDNQRQIELANVINNATDPYIDEIAYAIAYSAPVFLNSDYCFPQLFLENAQEIYSHDSDLKYVDIVDYGSSTTDENYYSTIKYYKIDTSGKKVQIEVPKEIYYEYIVHPKTTDEIAAYIDPTKIEYDTTNIYAPHVDNIANQPTGEFWRQFLYTYTEDRKDTVGVKYPILKDSITKCDVLWDETNKQRCAIKEITKWVKAVMKFDSKTERPHQPVRIYKLHLGRCGEHEDITNAASRACLIPCRGIEAMSSDHVWNEFWDQQWWQWEPVNNSFKDFYCYSKGWGKKFGSIIARESSGPSIPVTDSYCENTSKITIYVRDKNNLPVDGALVQIAVMGLSDTDTIPHWDNYGITDGDGKYTFTVEAGMDYFARMNCSLGNDPIQSSNVYQLVTGATAGKIYSFQLKAGSAMPKANVSSIQLPADSVDDYRIDVQYKLNDSFTNWGILSDDLASGFTYFEGTQSKPNIFVTDEDNYNNLIKKSACSAVIKTSSLSQNSFTFDVPLADRNWYCIFNGDNSLNNYLYLQASFALYITPLVSVENNVSDNSIKLNAFPNPMNDNCYISFRLKAPQYVTVDVFNSLGTKIKNLVSRQLEDGDYLFSWNGTDNSGYMLKSGFYFIRLTVGNSNFIRKVVLIK